jgi:ABC-type glycerol-3-phosphate transport system substrate-binding protein
MHKWLKCIILFVLILAGCNNSKVTQSPNTITFSFPESEQGFYRSLINDFYAQNPGITVVLVPTPVNQLDDQKGNVQVVSWDIASDEISWSADNYFDLQPFISKDNLINQDDFFAGVFLPFTNKDKLSAIPYGMDLNALNYNLKIFDQQEVPVPSSSWTWDNFLNTAARLTDREHYIYGYSASANYFDSLYFLYQNGGSLTDDKAAPKLDSEANVEAMGWYGRLFTTLNVAPTKGQAQKAFGFGEDVFALGIKDGKVGMWIGKLSKRGSVPSGNDTLGYEYGVDPLPVGKVAMTGGSIEAYAIANDTSNKDACWKLINFLTMQPNPRLIPARRSVADSLEYAKLVGAETAAIAKTSAEHTIVVRYDQFGDFIKARNAFLEAVSRIVTLESSAKQALEEAQKSLLP